MAALRSFMTKAPTIRPPGAVGVVPAVGVRVVGVAPFPPPQATTVLQHRTNAELHLSNLMLATVAVRPLQRSRPRTRFILVGSSYSVQVEPGFARLSLRHRVLEDVLVFLAFDDDVHLAGQADEFAGGGVGDHRNRERRLAAVHDAGVLQCEATLLAV